MTDLISSSGRTEPQYGSLKRRASSPVDRSRVVSRRRIDPLTPTDEYLSNDEQRALDDLTVKAIRAYRGTVFDPVHSLKSYIRVCDELDKGRSEKLLMRRLLDEREELELLLDAQKEFADGDLMILRNSPLLRRKLIDKLPGTDDKAHTPSHARGMISPPRTSSSHPSSASPRPSIPAHPSHPSHSSQGRILTPLQILSTQSPAPHIQAHKTPSSIKREPDTRLAPFITLPDITLPRSYGPPPPGQGSFRLSPTSPRMRTVIPSVARPVEPEGPSTGGTGPSPGGQVIPPHHYSTSPYALKPDSATTRSPGTPITAREALAAAGQTAGQPSVVASPVGSGPGQPPLPQPSPNTWFIPYHAPGPSGPNPLTFDFPKGTVKYDCPWCDKSYTGANARSVWRRHAQEKHNLPTLLRKRSRWDTGSDSSRPKTLLEKKERNLASKRQWAKDNRLKRKIQDQIIRMADDDPHRQLLQTELDNMSKKHKVWEYEWTQNGEDFPDIPASDGDDETDDEIEELPRPPPSVTGQPSPHQPLPPVSFRIPSDSSPVSPSYHKSSTAWPGPSGSGMQRPGPSTYASSSAGDSSGRPSMTSLPDGVGTMATPDGERKRSIGGISGYSADAASPRDEGSSGEEANPSGETAGYPPLKRRRRKPGEWVVKTDIDRCDLCQRRRVPECVVGPHKKACILCAKKKVQCGWSLSEQAHGGWPLGYPPGLLPPSAHAREQQLRERAAPWPDPRGSTSRRDSVGDVDMDYAYPSDDDDVEPVDHRSRLVVSPIAERNTLLRLDEALPPETIAPPQPLPQLHRRSDSLDGSILSENEVVGYTGAARCKGCIEDHLEECIVENRVCYACRDKGRGCEWTIADKFRSPPVAVPPASTATVAASSTAIPPAVPGAAAAEPAQAPQDRTSSVVLRQVIQLAEELRADKVRDEDVLDLMTRILRTKKGFKPGLVEWLEEDRQFYKERLLLLIEEMQEKYVNREKGTLGDCMEADRQRRGEALVLPVMPSVPVLRPVTVEPDRQQVENFVAKVPPSTFEEPGRAVAPTPLTEVEAKAKVEEEAGAQAETLAEAKEDAVSPVRETAALVDEETPAAE
ncbi:hypothetical protein CALCODRAFT_494662 [Calocera cornea HHB12733]|uniref:Uncharacterized protein n=1 Tax=Calocera cornea HHB12733 TaxID=1353952 RepID=A0A165GWC6_9BASI|nr:hypothetical protein CALCODRAFT_494662 [Calocera cornea HHB12733]